MKKLIIAGGTGFLGSSVASYFEDKCDEIVILTRGKSSGNGKVRFVHWDAATAGAWCAELEGGPVVLNTTGKSVDCRFTAKNKELILSSRINSTKILGECMLKCKLPPRLWINCSSAAIYGQSNGQTLDETSPPTGTDFMAHVARQWEDEFNSFVIPGIRKAILRISLILGNTGGVYPVLLGLAKKGLGGKIGNGKQMLSVIHIDDVCRIIEWLTENNDASGAYNIAVPQAIKNADFMALLRKKAGIHFGLPAPSWALKLGGIIVQKEPGLLLESHNTPPARLLQEGFSFRHETAAECVQNLD